MFDEIIACLDGSPLAETILPLACGLAETGEKNLALLRVVEDVEELGSEEKALHAIARQYSAELRFRISEDPGAAILTELQRHPTAIAALATHGRTALAETLLGSVALRIIRESNRPVITFRPPEPTNDAPKKIRDIVLALDGGRFSEQMIPYAAKAAHLLSARLTLIQALAIQSDRLPRSSHLPPDILESAYLQRKAAELRMNGIDAQWEVLHGEPAEAICRHLNGSSETMLAMTTHARSGLSSVLFGSTAGACMRHAGVPLLLYWPHS